MREIKFRAWDGERMWKSSLLISLTGTVTTNNEKYTLMQYTGLKDKNGTEIYEGDIVKCRHGIGVVKFHNASFVFDWDFNALNELMHVWKEDSVLQVEIIGNIYENPELLK